MASLDRAANTIAKTAPFVIVDRICMVSPAVKSAADRAGCWLYDITHPSRYKWSMRKSLDKMTKSVVDRTVLLQ
jgi:hypothetical protein